ncbi:MULTISPECIES: ABC transporter substrate-binding protein [unclassified Bradyrhizobium]|uniref:ABC transporter substrate-binding protein n=1 Tax=unclassified Bradyrhizobium TaxID=2631580 RepID=UPI00048500C5|nr:MULTISPECIES: ABC transporter substrate-binding protein [unclassified Bradyrhizobium]MCP3464701.1 ABC transporter substrate-binding protein [Bradyrhizobium sp. CCGUVB23]
MRRREFITLLGSAAVAWPVAGRAQQREQPRRVSVVMQFVEGDQQGLLRAAAFREGLEKAGWVAGRNVSVDYLWGPLDSGITEQLRQRVPEVIAINSSIGLRAIGSAFPGVPIVFIGVSEPVERGFVASLAHPGGNMTGFSHLEPTLGAKWLDLVKQVAPQVTRIAYLYNPDNPGAKVTLQSAQSAAGQFSLDVLDTPVRDVAEIEAGIAGLVREPGGALLVPPDPFTTGHHKRVVDLAARHRLPLVSALRSFADEGGLLAYGVSIPELFRQAAGYVDRILRGEKPADLPVQGPTQFELVINIKTATALGLTVPPALLAAANEVIE